MGIAAGPDGALWFTEQAASTIGKITTSGAFTEFVTPTAGSYPGGITAGPDGAHWLCAEHVRQLGGESPLDNLMEVKS
jgi:virginiamycin B lyase